MCAITKRYASGNKNKLQNKQRDRGKAVGTFSVNRMENKNQ